VSRGALGDAPGDAIAIGAGATGRLGILLAVPAAVSVLLHAGLEYPGRRRFARRHRTARIEAPG
jgi:hypothetical protein